MFSSWIHLLPSRAKYNISVELCTPIYLIPIYSHSYCGCIYVLQPHQKRSWWYWSNDVVKVSTPPTFVSYFSPGHPREIFFLIGRQWQGLASLLKFSPFSADEKRATPRDAVPAELRSVSWLRDECLNLSTHCPRLSNVLLQRAHVVSRSHL